MAPQFKRPEKCQVCLSVDSKYTCAQCLVVYCSVPCYKQHKENSCSKQTVAEGKNEEPAEAKGKEKADGSNENVEETHEDREDAKDTEDEVLEEPKPLKPLTSVRWPYIPDESAYPDPLKRDDPKALNLHQYESIATSPAIRKTLANPNVRELMVSIDQLRGKDREQALQKALGVTPPQIDDQMRNAQPSEEVLAFRELAEAIEGAVRGNNRSALGLDWGD